MIKVLPLAGEEEDGGGGDDAVTLILAKIPECFLKILSATLIWGPLRLRSPPWNDHSLRV